MKLLRYGPAGQEKPGLLDNDGNIRDLSMYISDVSGEHLSDDELLRVSQLEHDKLPLVEGNPRIGPCVTNVGKFICIGLNYSDHAAETGAQVPPEPIVFFKATSAICGPNDDIEIPSRLLLLTGKSNWAWSLASTQNTSMKPMQWITFRVTA